MQFIDALPRGPKFSCTPIKVGYDGPATETVELWHRNPIEVIKHLLGNPLFDGHMMYTPHRIFRKEDRTNREYSEMWSGDWWWNTQVS